MRDYQKDARKVGIATCLMLLCIIILLIWKSSLYLRVSGYELIGEFNNVNGLLARAEVRYRGYIVGKVVRIKPSPKTIRVYFLVENDVKIPVGSTLRVIFDGLVGEKYLDIQPKSKEKEVLGHHGVLKGHATMGLADFVDVGTQNLQELKSIVSAFNKMLTDEDVTEALRKSILATSSITDNLNKVLEELRIISEDVDFKTMVQNLQQMTARLNKALDEESISKVKKILGNMAEFTEELNELVKDGTLKTELIGAIKESKRMFRGTGDVLSLITDIKLDTDVTFQYDQEPKLYRYTADFDFWLGTSFLRFGVGNRLGEDKLEHIQQSIQIIENFRTRFGIFYTKPGIGLDYQFAKLTLSADMHQFNDLNVDILARYAVLGYLDILGGVYDSLDKINKTTSFGFSLHPPDY